MSNFDDNPFGEPAVDNPFAVSVINNWCLFRSHALFAFFHFIEFATPVAQVHIISLSHLVWLLVFPLQLLTQYHFSFFSSTYFACVQDPAVQQATRNVPQSNILEEYNPFEDDNRSTTIPIGQTQQRAPEPFPTYNQNSQTNSAYGKPAPQISTEELQVGFSR